MHNCIIMLAHVMSFNSLFYNWLQNNVPISTVISSHNSKMKNASLRTAPYIISAPKPRVWTRTAGVLAKQSLSVTGLFPSLKKANLWLLSQLQMNRCYFFYQVIHLGYRLTRNVDLRISCTKVWLKPGFWQIRLLRQLKNAIKFSK